MARKEIDFTVTDEGRDRGKVFRLREMPASQAEKWAMRALMLAAKNGVDIGESEGLGMAGVAMLGVAAVMKASFYELEPLFDEMMGCITIKPDPNNPMVVRSLVEDDIEEVKTRIDLRREVLVLHMGFSPVAKGSTPSSEAQEAQQPSLNTPTSQDQSVRFSQSPRTKQQR